MAQFDDMPNADETSRQAWLNALAALGREQVAIG
jgi:hypothetical protein